MFYSVKLTTLKNGKVSAECPDLRVVSSTDFNSEKEAMQAMCSGVPGMMYLGYRKNGKSIPLPSTADGEKIYIPVLTQAKILLWNLMVEKGIKVGQLASMLGVTQATASRLTDMTKDLVSISAVENAINALGGSLCLSVK